MDCRRVAPNIRSSIGGNVPGFSGLQTDPTHERKREMHRPVRTAGLGIGLGIVLAGGGKVHGQFGFSPLPSSVSVGSLPESAPFLLPAGFTQKRITHRFQNGAASPIGTFWDMIAVNLGGPQPGRFLFVAYEASSNAGVGRVDLTTNTITTIVQSGAFRRFDGCLWTPWNTIITGEEITGGRVHEVTNPLDPVGSVTIVTRTAVGRASHEGLKFDSAGNLYFIDEFNGGSIYKFAPANPLTASALSAGQIFALRDLNSADGANVGLAKWAPLNSADGTPIPGITDPTIDARTAANNALATNYFRPEDIEISRLANGNEVLYVATTSTDQVFSVELTSSTNATVRQFVSSLTINAATGAPVDAVANEFAFPDNLAIDTRGRIYIVEDNLPGDVWATFDADGDGIAEQIARFASLSTNGAEPTGLYFDPLDKSSAYIHAQHPFSGDDSLIRIVLPVFCPGDANGDGVVNFSDVTDVLGNWLNDYRPSTGPGDANEDGLVNFTDVTTVLGNWLAVCP